MAAIDDYLDPEGRVSRWPKGKGKTEARAAILTYLAEKFDVDILYSERAVNDILKRWHTFEDWALLRRELFERGYLNRTKDCSEYWRTPNTKLY